MMVVVVANVRGIMVIMTVTTPTTTLPSGADLRPGPR